MCFFIFYLIEAHSLLGWNAHIHILTDRVMGLRFVVKQNVKACGHVSYLIGGGSPYVVRFGRKQISMILPHKEIVIGKNTILCPF